MSYMDFSSWPRDQEQTFVVYEQRANESSKKAFMIGLVAAIGLLVLALGIYAGVEPDKRDIAKDMNMSNLTKKAKTSAPAPSSDTAPKQEAPKQDAPKTDTPAPSADKAAAPADDKAAAPADKAAAPADKK